MSGQVAGLKCSTCPSTQPIAFIAGQEAATFDSLFAVTREEPMRGYCLACWSKRFGILDAARGAGVKTRSPAQQAASRSNAAIGTALVAQILPAITALPGALFVRRNVGGARTAEGRLVKFGRKGQADIPGIYRGRAVEIECKAGMGGLTPHQELWRDAVERAGGLYIIARSVEQVLAEIQAAVP